MPPLPNLVDSVPSTPPRGTDSADEWSPTSALKLPESRISGQYYQKNEHNGSNLLNVQIALLVHELDSLTSRIAELEEEKFALEHELEVRDDRLARSERQREELIDRYESIIGEKERIAQDRLATHDQKNRSSSGLLGSFFDRT